MLVLEEIKDAVIEFRSTTCGICRKMKPIVDKLFKDNMVSFIELNIDDDDEEDNMKLAENFNVSSLPTFIHIVNGKSIGQAIGFHSLEELKQLLQL